MDSSTTPTIALYVCTYKRDVQLDEMLDSVAVAASEVRDQANVVVVVVDDNSDGRAASNAESFADRFDGEVVYVKSGAGNISIARNLGIETAIKHGDFVAMTDDDIIVPPTWFTSQMASFDSHSVDCVTGPAYLSFAEGSPRWLTSQPFDRIGLFEHDELEVVAEGSTGNSIIRSQFLIDNPNVRFSSELGKTGGEDMVFFRLAADAGLRCLYTRQVAVAEPYPQARSNFSYQMFRSLWIGNTEYLTNTLSDRASRSRLVARATKRLALALARPVRSMISGDPPQVHFALSLATQSMGMLAGAVGIRINHR